MVLEPHAASPRMIAAIEKVLFRAMALELTKPLALVVVVIVLLASTLTMIGNVRRAICRRELASRAASVAISITVLQALEIPIIFCTRVSFSPFGLDFSIGI